MREILETYPERPMPDRLRPMRPRLAQNPFDGPDWGFEPKHDGYRCIATVDNGRVRLHTRRFKNFDRRVSSIEESLRRIPRQLILDGEFCMADETGRTDLRWLQEPEAAQAAHAVPAFFIFDMTYVEGRNIKWAPFSQRKDLLYRIYEEHLLNISNILAVRHIEEEGMAVFKFVREHGLEGMVAKKLNSPYREGAESGDWLKVKNYTWIDFGHNRIFVPRDENGIMIRGSGDHQT